MRIGNSPAHKQAALNNKNPVGTSAHAYEGKVIAVNPEDSTVDVALYGGTILRRVRVLFNTANTVAGFRYLASIANSNIAQNSQNGIVDRAIPTGIADTYATILYVEGQILAPRVIGFTFPNDSQMNVNEQGLALFRHESGVYSLIDKNGHHETHYPDGSYIIAGPDTTPKELTTGKNSQTWKPATSASKINLTVHLAQGVTITVQNGEVDVTGAKKIVFAANDTSGDKASLTIDGAGSITASKTVSGTTTNATLI